MRPRRLHRRLIWRYAAVVVTLVIAAILSVGLTEFYFAYEDTQRTVTGLEADKASAAAVSIDQFVQVILDDLHGVRGPAADATERKQSFLTLLRRQSQISQLTYLNASGVACVVAYSIEVSEPDSTTCESDPSNIEEFQGARAANQYFGSVNYSDRDSRPHMTVAVAEEDPGAGVIVADVDLRAVLEALKRAQIGAAGYAYAVDSRGELIAHPNNDLVLGHQSSPTFHRSAPRSQDPAPPGRRRHYGT